MSLFYDVFNGDADGICALHQLRLEQPQAAELITGVKRDIDLVARVKATAGDEITVLDISFARNAVAVEAALASVSGDKAHLKAEAADVIYHLLVLLEAGEVDLADVLDELTARQQRSGIAEKASRGTP